VSTLSTGMKTRWSGTVLSVQPRIRLSRSFDERAHTYQGYTLRIEGTVDGEQGRALIGIGKAAQAKHQFRLGDQAGGESEPVLEPRMETAELYKTSKLRLLKRAEEADNMPPPWIEEPPPLDVYRARGCRRLAARVFDAKCMTCIWGCKMPVEMIIDHWKPDVRRYRFETVCYGPKSCRFYKAGPTRKVPGRKGMVYEEQDWVDEEATAHRGRDD
jgi:hypothetical protein